MRRREFITLLGGAAAWPVVARAQQPGKVWRIGFLSGTSRSAVSGLYDAFVQGMREHGYVDGKDYAIEWRSAEENYERIPEIAAEFVRLKLDIIVTAMGAALPMLKQTITTIPIVMAFSTDPVGKWPRGESGAAGRQHDRTGGFVRRLVSETIGAAGDGGAEHIPHGIARECKQHELFPVPEERARRCAESRVFADADRCARPPGDLLGDRGGGCRAARTGHRSAERTAFLRMRRRSSVRARRRVGRWRARPLSREPRERRR